MRHTIELTSLSIDLDNQWDAVFYPKEYNWIDFNIIHLSFETERVHGTREIEFYLLGLGIRLYWVYNEEVNNKKMLEYKAILDKGEFVEIK